MFPHGNDPDGQSLPVDPTDVPQAASREALESVPQASSALDAPELPPHLSKAGPPSELSGEEEEPVVVEDEPIVVEDEPVVVEEEPIVVEHEPVVVEDEPIVVEHEPIVVEEEPVVVEEPIVVEEPSSAPPTAKRSSLADRAPRPAVSALEALRAATRAEAASRTSAPRTARRKRAEKQAAHIPNDAPNGKQPSSLTDTALACLGDYELVREIRVADRSTFRAVWAAHRAHALDHGNLPVLAMASVLLDAAKRVPSGHFIAVELRHSATSYAAWVDTDRHVLLGIVAQPKLWLSGQ